MVYEGCNEVVHGVINQQNPTHIYLGGLKVKEPEKSEAVGIKK